MKFYSFSNAADIALAKFPEPPLNTASIAALKPENLAKCPYDLYIISDNPPDLDRLKTADCDKKMILDLHRAWQLVNNEFQDHSAIKFAQSLIEKYGKRLPASLGKLAYRIWQFSNERDKKQYFLLLKAEDPGQIMILIVITLLQIWQLGLSRIPLHACGIIHDGSLYLFVGPSGSGKSTVAELSAQIGRDVLDEDQLMIYKKDDGTYAANAWGYNLRRSNIPIRGFFKIIQDTEDRLLPMMQTHTTCKLMEQSIALTGHNLPDEDLPQLFERVSELARSVPGYELHFRKSPDFWKLIDDEFSKSNGDTP